jgi:hypothetical protein
VLISARCLGLPRPGLATTVLLLGVGEVVARRSDRHPVLALSFLATSRENRHVGWYSASRTNERCAERFGTVGDPSDCLRQHDESRLFVGRSTRASSSVDEQITGKEIPAERREEKWPMISVTLARL